MSISIVGVFSVSGCKAPAEEKAAVAEKEAAPAEEVEEVEAPAEEEAVAEEPSGKVLFWSYEPMDEAMAEAFNKTHPDIEVEAVIMGPWDMEDKLLIAIASGKGGPDATMVISRRFQRFASGTGMLDITDYIGEKRSDFDEGVFNMGVYQDRVFALTPRVAPVAMHYRMDLFEEYGLELPETMDDLAKIQEKLPEGVFTLPIFYPGAHWGAEILRGFLQLAGGNIYDEDGRVIINNTIGKETMSLLYSLVEDGIGYPVEWFTPEFYTEVKDGKVVLWITNIAEVANFKSMYPDMTGQWSTAPIPLLNEGAEAVTFTWGNESYAILAHAKNPDAAYEFIEWMSTSDEALDTTVDAFFVPAYKPYREKSEKMRTPDDYLGGDVALIDVVSAREIQGYNFIDWIQTSSIVGEALDAMFGGEKTPDEAWDYIEQRITEEGLGISD